MRFAIVKNGIVENVIEAQSADFMPGLLVADENAEPGGTYAAGVFARRVKTAAEIRAEALAELERLDLASIRAMREYITSKADAPQILKDREAAAKAAREKLAGAV